MIIMMVLNVLWFVVSYGGQQEIVKDYTLGRFIINNTILFLGFIGFLAQLFVRKDFVCWMILVLYILS
jgi:hypothetical protein